MFSKSITAQLPFLKKQHQTKKDKASKKLKLQSLITSAETDGLRPAEVHFLHKEASQVSRMKIPWCKSQFYLYRFCRRDREVRLIERTNELLESQLDIRSFMKLQTSYSTLLRLLFNKKQQALFSYQKSQLDKHKRQSSEDEHCYSIQKLINQDQIAKKFNNLEGFKVKSPLDKNLLKGLFLNQSQNNPKQDYHKRI